MAKLLRRVLLALVLALCCTPATAAGFAPGSRCHAAAGAAETYAEVAADPGRWRCSPGNWSIAAPRVYLRFDLRGGATGPERFDTRIAGFERLQLGTFERSGNVSTASFALDDMTPARSTWRMSAPLPGDLVGATAVVARFDQPRFAAVLSEARVVTAAQAAAPVFPLDDLALAGIVGLLIGPLLFNLVFYRVLGQRFMLWQAAVIACMIAHTTIASGLAHRVGDWSLSVLVPASILAFVGAVAAAAMFSAAFIETDKLDPLHRRALHGAALWMMLISLQYAFAPEPLRAIAPRIYFAGFLPVLAIFGWTLTVALRRGSRAARFQLAAWLPMMAVGLVRIASNAFTTNAPIDGFWVQHLAIVVEVTIAALGVADRIMTLRGERDRARSEVQVLASKADHDVLTGLMNRRALEQRFAALRADGFTTMAALDLDHFKAINDTHGHAAGDAVLRAVAKALAPDEDTLAVRFGGEEFLLLLRGGDAAERAERRRVAISGRVAGAVPGLGRIVTASMGLVEQSREVAAARDLPALFAHCDRLLYDAKRNGRNRTAKESLMAFGDWGKGKGERRAKARRGGVKAA